MKTEKTNIEQLGRTFLKSTSHVRVLDSRGNYFRSVAVGLQFGVIYFPGEIVSLVVWPLIINIVDCFYIAVRNLIFVIKSAVEAIYIGFTGHLDATNELIDNEDE